MLIHHTDKLYIYYYFQQKTVITRKDVQEAKIKTRSMAKESENKKVSLTEAKRNSRQKMLLKGNVDNTSVLTVKDIYGNVGSLCLIHFFFWFACFAVRLMLGSCLE